MKEPETLATIPDRLQRFGESPALIAIREKEPTTCSFAELGDRALGLAAGLRRHGVRPGDTVAIVGTNGPAPVTALLGIIAAGAVALLLDPDFGSESLGRMMRDNACRLAFIDETACEVGRIATGIDAERLFGLGAERKTDALAPWAGLLAPVAEPAAAPAGDATAVLVYTSGTTGTPKAVPLTHANIAANLDALLQQNLVGPGDRALLPLPLFHVYPLVVGLLTPLLAGAAIIFPVGLSGPQLAAGLRDGRATHLVGVPRLYTALVGAIRAGVAARGAIAMRIFDLLLAISAAAQRRLGIDIGRILFAGIRRRLAPELRLLVSGGAGLDPDTERTLEALGWEVLTGYGLTETAPILTFNRRGQARAGTAGQALPGVELRVASPDARGVGEIQVRGPNVFAGYRGNPEATAAAFTPDNWFRTGDLGLLDEDGYLHLVARASETIVLAGGTKLFPETIEEIFMRDPAIREIGLLVRNGVLVALVVPAPEVLHGPDAATAEERIRVALAAAPVAPYQRPAGFAVSPEGLPRTRIGKIRRHLLPGLYERARAGKIPTPGAPLSSSDRALLAQPAAARLWSWLQVRFRDTPLSLDTDLRLDLGIDSLSWLQITLELESALALRLDEAAIARITTVRDLLTAAITAAEAPAAGAPAGEATLKPEERRWLEPLSAPARALRTLLLLVNRIVVRALFGLRSDGIENLARAGPYLICPNHASYLDPFALAAALPVRIGAASAWAGWTGILFNTPARRFFSRIMRVLPIDPARSGASLALATTVLERGGILVWFPEGARSWDGSLRPFQPGIGILVRAAAAPVVPVHLDGTHKAWPPGRRLPRPGPVRVRIGQAIPASELLGGDADNQEVANRLHAAVAALAPP